jgi:hypothetical protein
MVSRLSVSDLAAEELNGLRAYADISRRDFFIDFFPAKDG